MRHSAVALGALAALAIFAHARNAAADEPAPTESEANDASRLFAKGSQLFLARRYAEALDVLRASYRATPSPSSGLLIARCLRQLGRPVEASEMYDAVEADARQRVDPDGEYKKTADAAAEEGAMVRASLASIHVHVAHATPSSRLELDGAPVALPESGDVLLWHVPGAARVALRQGGSGPSRDLTLLAGSDVRVELDAGAPPPPILPPAPPPTTRTDPEGTTHGTRPWAIPAALGSGVVAAAGLGIFAGFGLTSHAKFEDLSRACGPHACGDAQRADIASGERQQRIANVGFVIGAVGVAATATFVILHLTAPPEASSTSAALVVHPTGASLRGTFE